MFYSYVMGIDSSIEHLNKEGFMIEAEGDNYTVSFPEEKAEIWEEFIVKHLATGYWNEYLTNEGVVFLLHLEDGVKKYVVNNYENEEVLALCEKLCAREFESIKSMLIGNGFYHDKIK
jgi:hypothetical protein